MFKLGTVLRYLLLEKAVAILIALVVRYCRVGRALAASGLRPLRLSLVFDREIADPEAQALFVDGFDQWGRGTRLRSEFGIAPSVHVKFATEEDEPLLVLPDFVAGALHARILSSKGEALDYPPELVRAARDLDVPPSGTFLQEEECFSHKYPLRLEDGRVVRAGDAEPR